MSFKLFSNLVVSLGQTTKTNEKLALLKEYFLEAPDDDKVWTIALFTGRRPRRLVSGNLMGQWCMDLTGMPGWIFTECYSMVGDLSETIALLLPAHNNCLSSHSEERGIPALEPGLLYRSDAPTVSLSHLLNQLNQLLTHSEEEKKAFVLQCWQQFDTQERFVFNKLMSANFRVGVSANLPIQALAKTHSLTVAEVAHRFSGKWDPGATSFTGLLLHPTLSTDNSKPYPFYLAYPLEEDTATLGTPQEWQAEWKWDGIRGQVIKRNGEGFTWSRGEELITEKFPEFTRLFNQLPDGVCLDGEIVALPPKRHADEGGIPAPSSKRHADEGGIPASIPQPIKPQKDFTIYLAPFAELQKRIGRKNLTKKILADVPAGFVAYDLLEYEGKDIRERPLYERRKLLEKIFAGIHDPAFILSPVINFENWKDLTHIRTQSRAQGAEGLMLKRKSSPYGTGRRRGDWWKWKIDPMSIDAVMIYAQKGSGRRSNLYTDYTFAVRDGERLVPFTKAYSGLTDKEFVQVDAFVKKNAMEKFGPVRTVKPELVFEIGFEGIAESKRHKSGVALRFPRMLRWRTDKSAAEINTLDDLKKMLQLYGNRDNPVSETT
jgi:DNA ligase-1